MHSKSDLLEVDQITPEVGPLILCGDPGMGKTTEFDKLRANLQKTAAAEHEFIILSFRDQISDMADFRRLTVETKAWCNWRDGNGHLTLMVDGVDEGLIRIANFVAFLTGLLKTEPLGRLRLIMTCRSAEWPLANGRELASLWNREDDITDPFYEICPLRQKDVEEAAKQRVSEPQRFIESVWEMRVMGLAARPVTLRLLLQEFGENGCFPASHRELYERGIRKLADEIDPRRAEMLSALSRTAPRSSGEERIKAAQSIAVALLCSARTSVAKIDRGTPPGTKVVSLAQCASSTLGVSKNALLEVVESALFTSVGESTFGFAHQTFAECLAAQSLASLPLVQVRRLLLQNDDQGEHVVPQLAELAAWTAGYHKGFCDYLLIVDPTSLLRSDVALLSDQTKSDLVSAILSGADAGTVLDPSELYQFLFGLNHPGLADQLRPYLAEKTHSYIARRIAFQITERCKITELTDVLWSVVHDSSDNMHIEAAKVLCEVISPERVSEIEPLARGEARDDPDDKMRGSALERLIPTHWKIRDAFDCLLRPSNDRLIGNYHMLLSYGLPKHVEFHDVIPGLAWLQDQRGALHYASPRKELAVAILKLAFENLDNPAIAGALTAFWRAPDDDHNQIYALDQLVELKQFIAGKLSIKRHFIILLLESHTPPSPFDTCRMFGELFSVSNAEDFAWMLDQLVSPERKNKQLWASIVAGVSQGGTDIVTSNWDKLLQRITEVPELGSLMEWLNPWNLDEPWVRSAKAKWLKRKRQEKKWHKKWRSEIPDPAMLRREALIKAKRGDEGAWYDLWSALLHEEGRPEQHIDNPNVSSYPGWSSLSELDQRLARSSARLFLLNEMQDGKTWQPDFDATYAAIAAVWLLKDCLSTDCELQEAVKSTWAPHCARLRSFNDDHSKELFTLAFSINPEAALEGLKWEIENESARRETVSIVKAFGCWCDQLNEWAGDYLLSVTDPRKRRTAVLQWSRIDKQAALKFALHNMANCAQSSMASSVGLYDAIVTSLTIDMKQGYPGATRFLEADHLLAQEVWCHVCYHHYAVRGEIWKDVDEMMLADIWLTLHRLFPRSQHPSTRRSGSLTMTDAVIEVRDQIPGMLAARGTTEACVELRRLMTELPSEKPNLQWSYRSALINKRRNSWNAPDVESVRLILENAHARLIQSESDLKELVFESLGRFQQRLTNRMLPAVDELWRWDGAGNQRRNFAPKDEDAFSDSIARWLFEDIGPSAGVVVNREVQPRRGSRTDILVEAVAKVRTGDFERLTVVIEVKGCWHADVRSGMHTQLVNGYLKDLGLKSGIYVVGWFVCDRWKSITNNLKIQDLQEARTWLDAEVARYDGRQNPETVSAFVLDCSWPPGSPSQGGKG